MSVEKPSKIEKSRLPRFYRLILKVPGADLLENISSGIFWAVVVPIFTIAEFSLTIFLLLLLPFPINIVTVLIVPAMLLLMFIRISLERFLNWWALSISDSLEWNIDKTMPEYLEMLRKKSKEDN